MGEIIEYDLLDENLEVVFTGDYDECDLKLYDESYVRAETESSIYVNFEDAMEEFQSYYTIVESGSLDDVEDAAT
jgi:hypothetical protein